MHFIRWRPSARGLAAALFVCKLISHAVESRPLPDRLLPSLLVALEIVGLLWLARSRVNRLLSVPIVGLGVGMVAFIAVTIGVDLGLAARSPAPFMHRGVWSTRGLVIEGPEIRRDGEHNSAGAIRRAFERGARGVEVDVFYDGELGDFVVSHDRPYHRHDAGKGPELLMLGDLLREVGQMGAFWLDWKKLRHLSQAELRAALTRLASHVDSAAARERFYIEGEDPFHLAACRRAGFLTIYDTHPLPDETPLSSVVLDFYRAVYFFGGFDVMSMESGEMGREVCTPSVRKALAGVPLFVYHVPDDSALLDDLFRSPNVAVVLLRDHSADRFQQLTR